MGTQIEISFEDADLAALYKNLGAEPVDGLSDEEAKTWLLVNCLEPLVNGFLLGEINRALQNVEYDKAMAAAKVEQDALAARVAEAQKARIDGVPAAVEVASGAAELADVLDKAPVSK